MTSPVTLTTTASIVASVNPKRLELFLQNTGTTNAYFTKQVNKISDIPTSTKYDFILYGSEESGMKDIWIDGTAQINGVSSTGTTTIAVMEIIQSSSTGCR